MMTTIQVVLLSVTIINNLVSYLQCTVTVESTSLPSQVPLFMDRGLTPAGKSGEDSPSSSTEEALQHVHGPSKGNGMGALTPTRQELLAKR